MTGSHDNVILRRRSSPDQHTPGREAPLRESELEHEAVFDELLDVVSSMPTAAVPSTQVEEQTDIEGLIQTPEKRVILMKKDQLIQRQPTPDSTPAKRVPVAKEGIIPVPFRQLVQGVRPTSDFPPPLLSRQPAPQPEEQPVMHPPSLTLPPADAAPCLHPNDGTPKTYRL